MPIKQSAKKALRQSKKHASRNLKKSKAMKDVIKKLQKLIAQKKGEEANNLIPLVYKMVDKAAKTGVIKKNSASRKKSRLTKSVKKHLNYF